jgi:putative membrane protein
MKFAILGRTPIPLMKKMMLSMALTVCFAGLGFAAQGLTADEENFIRKAATSDQTEIMLSKLALERASSPQVKEFAQTMVTDHTKSTSLLKPIAADHGVNLPENPPPANDEKYQKLEKQSGTAFDKTYMEMMVEDHEDTLHAFETEAAKVADPKLKEFISTVQPIVAHHLEMAKALRQTKQTES